MSNTPQNQDHDDKTKPSQDQRSDGLKQTPQTKPDDKATKPVDDKRGQSGQRDAQR